jgi:hypothetical protein
MKAQGPALVLNQPFQFRNPVPSKDIPPGTPVQPTIVHVTCDEQGVVQESELLQTTGLSARALDAVANMKIGAAPNASGAPPSQREAYVRVECFSDQGGFHTQQLRR